MYQPMPDSIAPSSPGAARSASDGKTGTTPAVDVEALRSFVQLRLLEYRFGVVRIHIHRSSSSNAHDLRITLNRSTHMASLSAVEKFLSVAVERRFKTRLRSVYWRYQPPHSEPRAGKHAG